MLVFSRRRDEKVILTIPPSNQERTIEVFIVETYSEKVRLGFTAPKEIIIDREEVDQQVKARGQRRPFPK